MIENMRKYTGLMVVVLVLLAAGLILTMRSGSNADVRGGASQVINGESIDAKHFQKLGVGTLRVISAIADSNKQLANLPPQLRIQYQLYGLPLNRWAGELGATRYFFEGSMSGEELKQFISKRLAITAAAQKLGIYPSKERATEYLKEELFSIAGSFDKAGYDQFIKNIGSTGFSEDDVISLIGEFQVYSKLQNVITAGIEAPRETTEVAALFYQQTINLSTIDLALDTYKKDIKPTEEQLKNFWQENQGSYRTARQIQVSYILEKPVYSQPKPTLPVRDEKINDEDYKKLLEAYNTKMAAFDIIKKAADLKLTAAIDDLSFLFDDNSKDFAKRITEKGYNVTTTEFFTQETAPAILKETQLKQGGSIANHLLELDLGETPEYQIKEPLPLADGGWFYVRINEEVKPQPKPFEDAKAEVAKHYISQEAYKAMELAATKIKAELAAAVKSGKTLTEAALAQQLTVKNVSGLVLPRRQRGQTPSREEALFRIASIADSNSFTKEDIKGSDQITLIFLKKRVVENTAEAISQRKQAPAQASQQFRQQVFAAWINRIMQEAAEASAP